MKECLANVILLIAELLVISVSQVTSCLSFTAESYRNTSGYWHVEATVSHKDGGRHIETGLATRRWKYAVDVTTANNGEGNTMQIVFKVAVPPSRVGPDYTFYGGLGFYKLHKESVDWETAKRICEKEGTHLVIINSKEEEDVLKKILSAASDVPWVHVGFHSRFQTGQFTTVFGEPLSSTGYVAWEPGEPNRPDIERCGVAFTKTARLGDWLCNTPSVTYFVCEQEM